MEKNSWHNSSDFFYHIMVKFTISLISLSSAHLFVCFPNHLNYCCQKMRGGYKICTIIGPSIPESDYHLISPFNITLESNKKVIIIKGKIIN